MDQFHLNRIQRRREEGEILQCQGYNRYTNYFCIQLHIVFRFFIIILLVIDKISTLFVAFDTIFIHAGSYR